MRMNSFERLMLIASALMTLALSACRKPSASVLRAHSVINEERDGRHIILGFSQIGAESSWRNCNTQDIIQAAQKANIQILVDDAQQKQANQLKAIRSFIVYRVDVIAFVPIVETGWDNVLREAKEAHIPVIVVDRKIQTSDKSLVAGYIGEDTLSEGRKAAEFLTKYFAEKKGPLRIMEIRGTENSSAARERSLGFRQVIGDDRKFSIVYSESGDFLRSRGREIITQFMARNDGLKLNGKNIDIIFSHNDGMTLGVLDVLEKNGVAPGTDVVIVSVDGEQSAIDALKAGKLSCVVECNPRCGEQLMYLVKTVANKNTIPEQTFVQESVFTAGTDFAVLPPRGY